MSRTLSESLIIEGIKALREQKYTVGPGQEYSKVRDLPDGGYKMDSAFISTAGMASDPFARTATRTKDISDTDEFVSRSGRGFSRDKEGTVYTSRGIFGSDTSKTRNTKQSGRGDPMTRKDVSKIRTAAGSGTLRDRLRTLIPGKGSNY